MIRATLIALALAASPVAAQDVPVLPGAMKRALKTPERAEQWLTSAMKTEAARLEQSDRSSLDLDRLDREIGMVDALARANEMRSMLVYDVDWNGTISASEMRQAGGAMERNLRNQDRNRDGAVTLDELHRGAAAISVDPATYLEAPVIAMMAWDIDGDRRVTAQEIARIVAATPW